MQEPSAIHKQFAGVPLMKQVESEVKAVDEAARNADIEELRKLHAKMVANLRDTSNLMDMLVEHYSGKTNKPRDSDSAIAAMESVALAGLALAKAAIERG